METIVTILTKYVLGFGLQSFLMVLGVYTFNKQKVVLKEYLFTAVLVTLVTFLTKSLPISVGVQTILNMIFMYLVFVTYLKMQPYITIRSTALCVVLVLLSEIIVTAAAVMVFGQEQFQTVIGDASTRHIIGTLANIIFSIIIISFFLRLNRKGDYHRTISEQDS